MKNRTMRGLKGSLSFLNLLDHSGNHLSITNLAVYVSLIKLCLVTGAGVGDLGALSLSLMSYAHKRHLNDKAVTPSDS